MRALWRGLVLLVAFAGFMAGGLLGICASVGLTAMIWGPAVMDTALGSPPDHSHPAFWFWLFFMVPAMLVGMIGTAFGWMIPLCYFTGTRFGESREWLLLTYARWLRALGQPTGDFRAGLRPPQDPGPPPQ